MTKSRDGAGDVWDALQDRIDRDDDLDPELAETALEALARGRALEACIGQLRAVVRGVVHSVSCGDMENPFNQKQFIDGCNCGAAIRPEIQLARKVLDRLEDKNG